MILLNICYDALPLDGRVLQMFSIPTLGKLAIFIRILSHLSQPTTLTQHFGRKYMLRGSGSSILVPFNIIGLGPTPSCARKIRNVRPNYFYLPPSIFQTPHMFQRIEWRQLACMPSKCGFTNIIWSHEVPQAVSLSYEPTCHPLEDKKYEFNPPELPQIHAKALKLRLATILLSQTCVNLRSYICVRVSDTIQPVHWVQSPGFSSFSRLGHTQ
jgi:hypothetical protein